MTIATVCTNCKGKILVGEKHYTICANTEMFVDEHQVDVINSTIESCMCEKCHTAYQNLLTFLRKQ